MFQRRIFLPAVLGVSFVFTSIAGVWAQDGVDGSTVVYGEDFIAGYPNAVTVVDIIERIPGGSDILFSGGGDARGFSGNRDSVLINGKRVSGKSNDGSDALGRITIEQVERVELIRGGSPDVKVSSQEAILNVVLKEGVGTNAGSWRADTRFDTSGHVRFGGQISYGGSLGKLDYFASAERFARRTDGDQVEREFNAQGGLLSQLNELEQTTRKSHSLSANIAYNFENGDVLRLNGKWGVASFNIEQPGQLFKPDNDGSLAPDGTTFRTFRRNGRPDELEVSGDYETSFKERWTLKLLALYSRSNNSFFQAEDLSFNGEDVLDDFQFLSTDTAKESIARASLTWTPSATHSLETGSEIAVNTLSPNVISFERIDGELVGESVEGADVRIKEERNESFFIHSWAISDALSLESSVFSEYSKISQNGENLDQSRTFFFIKPSADLRYNITSRQQFQLSIRRRVSQLNFGDFAASVSGDDEVVGANADLVPQKRWEVETSYEYRLPNDGGSLKLSFAYEEFQDFIQRIETSPGVSGVGNVGSARRYGPEFDGTLRLGFINLPDAQLEASLSLNKSQVQDPFTGEKTRFNRNRNIFYSLGYRHDVRGLGLSYGVDYAREGNRFFRDIDEVIEFRGPIHRMSVFVEKTLIRGVTMNISASNLINSDRGRTRFLFDDGVALGVLSRSIVRNFRQGRNFRIRLKGVF